MAKLITNSNTLTGIKFETFSDIPKLQLWLDASDENTIQTSNFGYVTLSGASWYLDGVGDRFLSNTNTESSILSGDFTIETWINVPVFPSSFSAIVYQWRQSAGLGGYGFSLQNSGQLAFFYGAFSEAVNLIPSTTRSLSANIWQHIAVCREGSQFTIFIDGLSAGGATFSGTRLPLNVPTTVGNYLNSGGTFPANVGQDLNGNLSNLRIVKGQALYPATGFTVPSAPLSVISGPGVSTEFLLFQNSTLQNSGNSANTVSSTGNPTFIDLTKNVTNWLDKSPNALTTTQPVINNQTTYLSAEINNLNVLNFDGTDDFLTLSTPISTGISYTQFFVFNRDANNINSVSLGNAGGPTMRNYGILWRSSDRRLYSYTLPTNQNRGTASVDTSGTHIVSITQSIPRNTVDFYLDGINRTTNSSGSLAGQSLTASDIGRSQSDSIWYHNGQYGEVVQMAFEAPRYEVDLINRRLLDKWKIAKVIPRIKTNPIITTGTSTSAVSSTLGTWYVEPTSFQIEWQKSLDSVNFTTIVNTLSSYTNPFAISIYNPTPADYGYVLRTSVSATNSIGTGTL